MARTWALGSLYVYEGSVKSRVVPGTYQLENRLRIRPDSAFRPESRRCYKQLDRWSSELRYPEDVINRE